jgi:hypothetical protein
MVRIEMLCQVRTIPDESDRALPVADAGPATNGGMSRTIIRTSKAVVRRLRGGVMAISFVRLARFRMLARCISSVSSSQPRRAPRPSRLARHPDGAAA